MEVSVFSSYNSEPFHQNGTECTDYRNVEWTTGFWTGLIWLMYDWSRRNVLKNSEWQM